MRRLSRLFLLVLAVACLQGCSAVRVGYGNADSLARWWLDQYLELSPEQNQLVAERLARLHAWHRRSELKAYAAFLGEVRVHIDRQPNRTDALLLGEGIVGRARMLAEKALPDVADLLLQLRPAQIEQLKLRFAEKNRDYAKETGLEGNETLRQEARFKRLLSRAEYWFGRLGDGQRAEFRRLIFQRPSGAQFHYEERLRRQRELLELAERLQREQPGREPALALLRDYLQRFEATPDPERRAASLALREDTADLAVALHAMATPAQRTHARERIDDLIREFSGLAGEA